MDNIQTGKIEVDQSIRIEELTKDTMLGIANEDVAFITVVPKRTKRVLYEMFRVQGKIKKFAPYVFAAAAGKAIYQVPLRTSDLIVDIEYPGYEREIIWIIKQMNPGIEIYFTAIGRRSPAHYAAYGAYIGKKNVDFWLDSKTLIAVLFKENKNGSRIVTPRNKSGDSQPK